ncbi:hypothetical protein DFH08DRAFT_980478 [Mycena albidolilacea]|uniref:Transmembrane protein n=1 Tax=Mycena albidolilacea TaxID=1033008 RepID=A0AAD7ATL8_9AGAR|nr:hypothetical protein DFH08DRAFT_980478 [Mycena albidolilacea]
MPFLFFSFPSARTLFRTAVTVFLTLWFLAYPFITYCTGLTAEERTMELNIRQFHAFSRLQDLYAPQVLRLRYLDENDPKSTIFIEVAPPSSFSPFLAVDAPPVFGPTTTRVVDATNTNVDASLVSAPRPGALPAHGPLLLLPLVFGLTAVAVFVLVGVAIFIKTAIMSTEPSLALAVTQGQTVDVERVVVAEDDHERDIASLFDNVSTKNIVLSDTLLLSSDDFTATIGPEPVDTANELDFGDVFAPNVVLSMDLKHGEPVAPVFLGASTQITALLVPEITLSNDSTPVVAVGSAERGSRPDRERVCTEAEATPLRASERTRTRTAPGHQLVTATVPGAAVSRILPLPPMPVVQRPAPVPVSSCSSSPASASSPIAPSFSSLISTFSSHANTTILDIPGAILYQTQAPTSSRDTIYSTGPSPPSVQYCQVSAQPTRHASKIVFHGRSGMPPHAAPLYLPPVSLRQPMGTNLRLLAAQEQYSGYFDRNPHFQSQFYAHHPYSAHAGHRALSAR